MESSDSTDAEFGYRAFQRALIRIAADLARLSSAAGTANLSSLATGAEERLDHFAEGNFVVAVIGAFKRGKSTLTNALLGAPIMPADVSPATATLNRVIYGREPRVTLTGRDGRSTRIGIGELSEHVTKLSETAAARAQDLAEAVIEYPTYLCANNVQLLDTPGLDDDETMTSITEGVLSKIDAAIFVTSATAALGQSELNHLDQLLQHVDRSCIVLAVTYFDLVDEEDRERVLNSVRQRAAPLLGNDPPIFGIAGRAGLSAKQGRDDAGVRASGLASLEEWLEHFLVRESGFARLRAANGTLLSLAEELKGSVDANLAAFVQLDEEQKARLASLKDELEDVQESLDRWTDEITEWTAPADAFAGLTSDLAGQLSDRAQKLVPSLNHGDANNPEARHSRIRQRINPQLERMFDTRADEVRTMLVHEVSSRRDALAQLAARWVVVRAARLESDEVAAADRSGVDWPSGINAELVEQEVKFEDSQKKFATSYGANCDYMSLRATFTRWFDNVTDESVQALEARTREHVANAARIACNAGDLDGTARSFMLACASPLRAFAQELTTEIAESIDQLKWQLDLSGAQLETTRAVGAERLRLAQATALDIQRQAVTRRNDLQQLAIVEPNDAAYA